MDSELLKAVILGIIQGVTEFFPVSSTAHLILTPWFMGWEGVINTLSFDVALHGGTLIAIFIYFYKDFMNILLKDRRLLLLLIIATIPGALLGKIFNELVETTLRDPLIICVSLIVVGVFMLMAERVGRKSRSLEDIGLIDAVLLGISQAVAMIPGVSRSGITISTGLLKGLKRQEAARMSFLMSAPIIGGATLFHCIEIFQDNSGTSNMDTFIVGVIASFISGLLSIKFLMSFFQRFTLKVFVYYRFVLAIIIGVTVVWLKV